MGEQVMRRGDLPLPALFEEARKIHDKATESGVDQELLREGRRILEECEDMISKLGLFSRNEAKDDISTANLKYTLAPFYLAELTEKIAEDDRMHVLRTSQAKLKEFLSFCEAMELVPEEELETSAHGGANSVADRRALKVARFKRQRAAEAKLLEIKERKERRVRSSKAAALSTPIEAGEEDMLDDDGEEEREAWLTTVSLAICKALDLLEMLKKEEEMLSAVKERQLKDGEGEFSQSVLDDRVKKAEVWHRNAAVRARYTKPAQPITCATHAQDIIEGRANVLQAHEHKHQPVMFGPASLVGGSLTSERERIAAQVFQPHHRLPTMSIEEAGLREMEMMNTWQERNAKLMEEANSAWYKDNRISRPDEEDEDEDDDAAVEKARAWDDWKDDNPRGAGNKKLTPCG
ncbi:PP2A regulatory subunit TAP46 [Tripterygium wilfordii]|uniref:PP2A regulatory subunit TAP46 n=1 Tax=Tripterygium wilfordii TaxID=458696 RepID=A0A7J7CAX9_TRIWF|nr:PP2A regulatory subunit TAP46 isoform X2 [Tripterygium wilfordii]KAF5731262.1 PP2A regulatory subunit TAP46 [Tripterygium wilfordii]